MTEQQTNRRPGPTVGYVLSSEQFPVTDLVEYGVAAEQAGFDAVWSSDHFQPWQDNQGHASLAWLTLAAVGQRTHHVLMGTGVTCPTFRYNPAIVAQAFATLGLLYPGRVFLGVGTGEALNEQTAGGGWGDYDERAARLVEAVEMIRSLWTGEIITRQGKYYDLLNAKLYSLPEQPVPIYIAASGPNSMRLAGQYGDGLISDTKSTTDPTMREAFNAGATAVGKEPDKLVIMAEHWVVVGDEAEARKYAPLWQFNPKSWQKYVNIPDPREIEREAKQEVPLDKVYESWLVSPDADTHAQEIQKLIDAGVTHVMVHSPQPDQRAIIDFYGNQVLPRLSFRSGQEPSDVYLPPILPHLESPSAPPNED
jgi:TAT-translocated FGD2 family F420-dependent dehydrogenase